MNRIAIIADVCLLRDATEGDNYWSIKDSRAAGTYMIESAKTYVANRGYEVVLAEAPLVGSFKKPDRLLKFAAEKGGQVGEMYPPLFVADGLAADQTDRESLTTIISGVVKAVAQRATQPSNLCCAHPDMKQALDTISQKTGGDAILFLIGNGVLVPAGKSVAQGVATGVLTTVLTLGMFTCSSWSVSWLDTLAALVDVETGDILWSNSLRLKGGGVAEKDYYAEKWPTQILYYMPSKSQAKAN